MPFVGRHDFMLQGSLYNPASWKHPWSCPACILTRHVTHWACWDALVQRVRQRVSICADIPQFHTAIDLLLCPLFGLCRVCLHWYVKILVFVILQTLFCSFLFVCSSCIYPMIDLYYHRAEHFKPIYPTMKDCVCSLKSGLKKMYLCPTFPSYHNDDCAAPQIHVLCPLFCVHICDTLVCLWAVRHITSAGVFKIIKWAFNMFKQLK